MKRAQKSFDRVEPTAKPIKDLLAKQLEKIGRRVAVNPSQILELWPEIVGPEYAPFCKALSFEKGKLTIKVKHAVALAQLEQYEKPKLLVKLQRRFPEFSIETLLFRM